VCLRGRRGWVRESGRAILILVLNPHIRAKYSRNANRSLGGAVIEVDQKRLARNQLHGCINVSTNPALPVKK